MISPHPRVLVALVLLPLLLAADWPQFQGPNRDGISTENGLLSTWPADGPPEVWRVPLGDGYSSVAVVGGLLYTQEADDQHEYLTCLRAEDGARVWRLRLSSAFRNDQGDGPHATPTVDGGMVFALSGTGVLLAADAIEGVERWRHDLVAEYEGKGPYFGYSGSPLVVSDPEGDKVIVEVGGDSGTFAAFRRTDGSLLWRGGTGGAGYAAPVIAELAGVRQLLFFHAAGLTSVDPESGRRYWHDPWKTLYGTNVATPVLLPNDRVFVSASYDIGGSLLQVTAADGEPSATTLWRSRDIKTHFHSAIYHEGHLYGFDDGTLKCLEANGGETRWAERGRGRDSGPALGKGSVLLADGKLLLFGERGTLVLAEATPVAYRELGRRQVFEGKSWALPALANGFLYLRGQISTAQTSTAQSSTPRSSMPQSSMPQRSGTTELVRLDLRSSARRTLALVTGTAPPSTDAAAQDCLCDAEVEPETGRASKDSAEVHPGVPGTPPPDAPDGP